MCDALAALELSCNPCPDGELACVDMRFDDLAAEPTRTSWRQVTRLEVDSDPECAD